ncbi:hypothetical protein HYX17_02495 [Candidatus Woesearchaeota archaeon]|nr:hypothetical protein [Candidatus Woesearchaeota archaeon]
MNKIIRYSITTLIIIGFLIGFFIFLKRGQVPDIIIPYNIGVLFTQFGSTPDSFWRDHKLVSTTFRVDSGLGDYNGGKHKDISARQTCNDEFDKRNYPVEYYSDGNNNYPIRSCWIEGIGSREFECEGNTCHTNAYVDCDCFYAVRN